MRRFKRKSKPLGTRHANCLSIEKTAFRLFAFINSYQSESFVMFTPEIIEIIGISGGMLILGAWAFETLEAVKHHKKLLDLKFSFISLIGTILLAIYALQENLGIFLWLNTIIAGIILFEIGYSLHVRKIHRRR